MNCQARTAFSLTVTLMALACRGAVAETTSVGTGVHGWLLRGRQLPRTPASYRRLRDDDPTYWGLPRLLRCIESASAQVAAVYPGREPWVVGDLSLPGGGAHPRHRSHRSGRDVDLFFAANRRADGLSAAATSRFDRFGSVHTAEALRYPARNALIFADGPNAKLVSALVDAGCAPVNWVLVSEGIKSRLLRWLAHFEEDPDRLEALMWLLHQPPGAEPHDDHLHLRLDCSVLEAAAGCESTGPSWPWLWRQVAADRQAALRR